MGDVALAAQDTTPLADFRRQHRRGLPVRAGLALTAAVGLLIAMGEIDRLAGAVVDNQGRSWPFTALMGPSRLLDHSPTGWIAGTQYGPLEGWLRWYLVLDLIFIGIYAVAGFRWLYPRALACAVLVLALGVVDVLEDVLAMIIGLEEDPQPSANFVQTVLPWVSCVKCLLVIAIGLGLLRRVFAGEGDLRVGVREEGYPMSSGRQFLRAVGRLLVRIPGTRWLARLLVPPDTDVTLRRKPWIVDVRIILRSLMVQRFSLLPLLPMALLGLAPGADMADQLPDVQRRWADGGIGLAHAFWAAVAVLTLTGVMFTLGRLRADFTYQLVFGWVLDPRDAKKATADKKAAAADPAEPVEEATVAATVAEPAELGDETLPSDAGGRPEPLLWIWWRAPVVVLVAGLVIPWMFHTPGLSLTRLLIFTSVPLVVWGFSKLLSKARKPKAGAGATRVWLEENLRRRPGALREEHAPAVELAGDTLACLGLVVGGLGLVRSFTADVTLTPSDLRAWAFLIGGGLLALGTWPAFRAFTRAMEARAHQEGMMEARHGEPAVATLLTPGTTPAHSRRACHFRVWVLAGSSLFLVVLGCLPLLAAHYLGVIASITFALLFLTCAVGSMVVLLQAGGAPYLFWLPVIRLRAAPVVSLLVITVLWASLSGGAADVHGVQGLTTDQSTSDAGVRGPVNDALTKRQTIAAAFEAWTTDKQGCLTDKQVGDHTYRLRPLVLAASEGGGIRAAYWAAAGMQLLNGHQVDADGKWTAPAASARCGSHSVLFASGASGGSVGLTVARFAPPTASGPATARDQVVAMGAPDALGAAAIGMVVRDVIYSAVGVPLPAQASFADRTPQPWQDRAALMERAWKDASKSMSQTFLPYNGEPADGTQPWHLVFGSASMTSGCRELVSQLTLQPPVPATVPAPQEAPTMGQSQAEDVPANGTCTALTQPAPQSADLLDEYSPERAVGQSKGPKRVEGQDVPPQRCLGQLSAATAAMLSARFPYVTPSGVVGACGERPVQQLVDGGYTENTGLGTIVDLSSQWLPLVQEYNGRQLAGNSSVREVVVPLVVYFDNGTGSDLVAPSRSVTSEILVPPVGKQRAGFAQADTPALLQRAAALADVSQLWAGTDTTKDSAIISSLQAEIRKWRPRPVSVVHQATVPAVTAPLGWVLSSASVETMDKALNEQATHLCSETDLMKKDALCRDGFGALAEARDVLVRAALPAQASAK